MATKKGGKKSNEDQDTKLRIAIINKEKCKPKKCGLQCKKVCPVNESDKQCITVTSSSVVADISEILCIGCNMCVKKCPFTAIKIINLPKDMSNEVTHRFGPNQFKLHRLPYPRPGQVLGLVGTNGIGKSTALKILANKFQPNLGRYNDPPGWDELLKYFRGSELQNYFQKMINSQLKAMIKIQYVDAIPKQIKKGTVKEMIDKLDKCGRGLELANELELGNLLDREVKDLSGGELQRFAILIATIQEAEVVMYDEPSSYLDVKQRLSAARFIRAAIKDDASNYVICVEHDLAVLDYLSDFICCLYGQQSAYGVVTHPFGVREGINVFLSGNIPSENMRFREYELSFRFSPDDDININQYQDYKYPDMNKKQGDFELDIKAGKFTNSQIIVMLGQNGTGKTTFIKMLAGKEKDPNLKELIPELSVSYKPQTINPSWTSSVRDLLNTKIGTAWQHPAFTSDVCQPLKLEDIIDNEVQTLSGGELQRVALILALGKPAQVYLIDEPSAYLDSEQRIITAKVIKRYILNTKKAAFIVEHDFIMATYLADLVIVYEGSPGVKCVANPPQELITGMNKFLDLMEVTFRRDPENFRPRINKYGSTLDREQKKSGRRFVQED